LISEIFRFPSVSSSILIPPSRPTTRPYTAPEMTIKPETAVDLPSIDENVIQPTKVDLQHDVQILTLTDSENEQVPF